MWQMKCVLKVQRIIARPRGKGSRMLSQELRSAPGILGVERRSGGSICDPVTVSVEETLVKTLVRSGNGGGWPDNVR